MLIWPGAHDDGGRVVYTEVYDSNMCDKRCTWWFDVRGETARCTRWQWDDQLYKVVVGRPGVHDSSGRMV